MTIYSLPSRDEIFSWFEIVESRLDHNYTCKVFYCRANFPNGNLYTRVIVTPLLFKTHVPFHHFLVPLLTFVIITSSSWQGIHLIIHRTRVIGPREIKSSVPADYSKPGRQRRPEGWYDAFRSSESPWNWRYVNEILYSTSIKSIMERLIYYSFSFTAPVQSKLIENY